MKRPIQRRGPESGYALLFVFAMAATAAIMLYTQLPRAAFEAQRDKEQLLVDRGQQYSRAIQLFVRKYNRFPPDMDALENTQSIRFLRHRYKDPMTGKDDWRIIHVGPGGIFTDSLVHGAKKKDQNAPQTFITELQPVGGNTSTQNEGVNLAARRRPSDQAGAPGDPNSVGLNQSGVQPGSLTGNQPGNGGANNPGAITGPVMVLPDGRIVPATITGMPASPGASGLPGASGQPNPGQLPGQFPGQFPGQQAGPFPGGLGSNGANGMPPGFGQQGLPNGFQNQPNGAPPGAANLINQLLTTPRPGGMNGLGGITQPGADPSANITGTPVGQSAAGGQVIGGGIGGVASKLEQEGIKVFNERKSYHEWEFVYDMTKDPSRGGGRGGMPTPPSNGAPASQNGTPGGQNGNTPGSISPTTGTQQ